jgi:hypothetical protein
MGRIVRLTERDLTRLVKRVIREEEMAGGSIPECLAKMEMEGKMEPMGGGYVTGSFNKISFSNRSESDRNTGYTIYQNGNPYCFVSKDPRAGNGM